MKMRIIIVVAAVLAAVVGVAGWYWFRPELLFVNARVQEKLTEDGPNPPALLARGKFHTVAHESRGTASVYRLEDGHRVLRLTDFETSNGPQVHVYLVAAADAADSETVKKVETLDLGPIKGNVGDQNYELPAEFDLTRFRAVTVWCKRFSVNFATAPLSTEAAGL